MPARAKVSVSSIQLDWSEILRAHWQSEHFAVFGGAGAFQSQQPLYLFCEPLCIVSASGSDAVRDTVRAMILEPIAALRGTPFESIPCAAGFLSYEYQHALETIRRPVEDPFHLPDLSFALFRKVLRAVPGSEVVELFEFDFPSFRGVMPRWLLDSPPPFDDHFHNGTIPFIPKSTAELSRFSNFSRQQFLDAVVEARALIKRGWIYQANLSQRYAIPGVVRPDSLFTAFRHASPAAMGAYVALPSRERWIVSASPERLFELWGNNICCSPIKGTRPRSQDSLVDGRMREELRRSPKDDAELSMIVDLVRNDLSKIAVPGSVIVPQHARLESLAQVHHLVSDVTATIPQGVDVLHILDAMFPCGSITGAPKIAASQSIAHLERTTRGIYTGAIGCFGASFATFNVAIRTATVTPDNIFYQSGAGIVWDSVPEKEYAETLAKAQGLVDALQLLEHPAESNDKISQQS